MGRAGAQTGTRRLWTLLIATPGLLSKASPSVSCPGDLLPRPRRRLLLGVWALGPRPSPAAAGTLTPVGSALTAHLPAWDLLTRPLVTSSPAPRPALSPGLLAWLLPRTLCPALDRITENNGDGVRGAGGGRSRGCESIPHTQARARRDGLTQADGWSGQCRVPEPEYSTSSLTSTETALRMKDRNRLRWM